MRILKLVIWDLDETILSGVLEESGVAEINSAGSHVMAQLRARGTLQTLATHNQSEVLQTALEKFEWSRWFCAN
jgi:methoxymalonate biosynthesis protein